MAALMLSAALIGACGSGKPTAKNGTSASPNGGTAFGTPAPGLTPAYSPPASWPRYPGPTPASGERPPYGGPPPASAPRMNDALNCRIAVSNGTPGSGGFLVFPGGQFQPDSGSNVTINWPASSSAATGPGNFRPSSFGLTYVHSARVWVPVPRSWVASDGSRYAYPDPMAGGIHVESLTGVAETILGPDQQWVIVDVEAGAVYATPQGQGAPPSGLWRLPTDGSSGAQVIDHGNWHLVSGGAAWGVSLNNPPQGVPNPIVRHDLNSGSERAYANVQGQIIGLDAVGDPVVTTNSYGNTVLGLLAPSGSFDPLWAGYNSYVQGPVVADQWGVWFTVNGNQSGLMRWTGAGSNLASNVAGQLGGGCF